MKFRTDFVTNSSSSGFVTVNISTENDEYQFGADFGEGDGPVICSDVCDISGACQTILACRNNRKASEELREFLGWEDDKDLGLAQDSSRIKTISMSVESEDCGEPQEFSCKGIREGSIVYLCSDYADYGKEPGVICIDICTEEGDYFHEIDLDQLNSEAEEELPQNQKEVYQACRTIMNCTCASEVLQRLDWLIKYCDSTDLLSLLEIDDSKIEDATIQAYIIDGDDDVRCVECLGVPADDKDRDDDDEDEDEDDE